MPLAEVASQQPRQERDQPPNKQIAQGEGAAEQQADDDGDGGRDAGLHDCPPRRLQAHDVAADREARDADQRAQGEPPTTEGGGGVLWIRCGRRQAVAEQQGQDQAGESSART